MEMKSSSKKDSPVLSKAKKQEFGSGLWVSLMLRMKEFRPRAPKRYAYDGTMEFRSESWTRSVA